MRTLSVFKCDYKKLARKIKEVKMVVKINAPLNQPAYGEAKFINKAHMYATVTLLVFYTFVLIDMNYFVYFINRKKIIFF